MSKDTKPPRELLDERYARILRAIHREGGSANTTEVKALTGISTNQIITQRMDNLAEWDFVRVGYQQAPKDSNRLPTKVATLTPYGRQVVESGTLDYFLDEDRVEDVADLNERVGEIDRRVAALEGRLADVEGFLREHAGYDS